MYNARSAVQLFMHCSRLVLLLGSATLPASAPCCQQRSACVGRVAHLLVSSTCCSPCPPFPLIATTRLLGSSTHHSPDHGADLVISLKLGHAAHSSVELLTLFTARSCWARSLSSGVSQPARLVLSARSSSCSSSPHLAASHSPLSSLTSRLARHTCTHGRLI